MPTATLRRAVWGVADQALYSLTNFSLAVFVAQSGSQRDFGAFAALLIIYTFGLGVVEALTAEVFTVVHSSNEADLREPLKAASGAAFGLGLLAATVAVVASSQISGPLAMPLLALGLILPALFLQNFWRYAMFALGRPGAALVNDLTWALVEAIGFVVLATQGSASVAALVMAWGIAAAASAALGAVQLRLLPNPLKTWSWLKRHYGLGLRFSTEWITLYGASQFVLGAVATQSGLAELAKLRAAQLIFGPLQGLLSGARLSLTSFAVRIREHDVKRLAPFIIAVTAGLGSIATCWAAIAILLPGQVGTRLFGQSWNGAATVLLPVAVSQVAFALALGPLTALRACRAARRSAPTRTITALLILLFGVSGATIAESVGAAAGVAVASVIGLLLISRQAAITIRHERMTLADQDPDYG